MLKKRQQQEEENQLANNAKEPMFLRKKSIKELIAPSGIDASNVDHLEIISNVKRYARSFYVSSLPRSCIFPELFRSLYMFGDINTSIYIKPISEAASQNELFFGEDIAADAKAKIKVKRKETKKGGTKDAKEKTTTRGRKPTSK